jgi:hypothetical protein
VSSDVEAAMVFTCPTTEKPVAQSQGPRGHVVYPKGTYEERVVTIANLRPRRAEYTLDRHGFMLADHPTAVADFRDDRELDAVYYPEVERLIAALTGAARVVIFDHTRRTADEAAQRRDNLREPVRVVHNDYTDWSGPQRVRDVLPDEAAALLARRVAVIQVWRSMRGTVVQQPLALCDARSIAPADLIAAERRHPNRVGEIYQIAYNPAQRWYYAPALGFGEALVFKTYDSATDGRARFSAHGSFLDPTAPADAAPRESIEVRAFAFFDAA